MGTVCSERGIANCKPSEILACGEDVYDGCTPQTFDKANCLFSHSGRAERVGDFQQNDLSRYQLSLLPELVHSAA